MKAEIKNHNGIPSLFVDGKLVPEMAYITYKLEDNCYDDFSKAGFKFFSVCLNFSEMPINENAPVLIMDKGIFENDEPDFSIVDRNFDLILNACPDAYIFPRVNVNPSESWELNHPDELNDAGYGERRRYCISSDIWADYVKEKLTLLIEYIENSKYKDNVVGYQIAGGNTDEWLPLDNNANYGKRFREKYKRHLIDNNLENTEENRFMFASEVVAERITDFCELLKKLTGYNKLSGAFYGYIVGGLNRERCHCALDIILKSDAVDFLCAPVVYNFLREPGTDLYTQLPTDSLRLHNKIFLSENDIRTHKSNFIHTHPNYTKPIWLGPDKEKSMENIKLAFSRAFTHGYGMWWFDMWGGWYKDKDYMFLMKKMTEIISRGRDMPDNEIALFIDARGYTKLDNHSDLPKLFSYILGLSGVSCDIYEASDFYDVYKDYELVMFLRPGNINLMEEFENTAKNEGINTMIIDESMKSISPDNLRELFIKQGITPVVYRNVIIHKGKKYICLYSLDSEEINLSIDKKSTFKDVFSGKVYNFPTRLEEKTCYLFER